MTFELKEEIPSVRDYIDIRLKAGLSEKSVEAATLGLPNSIYRDLCTRVWRDKK